MIELLAGYPFHIAPAELMEFDAAELAWWHARAAGRLEAEAEAHRGA
ncbi:GpE family phage tail protein [Oceanibacterium hippocampi]|uniref:Phage P2 GpE n=1 Tax=Oceanibacterium hippocampi TaxID=745714 RepID=A0A1Y5U073_9PROT|nr:GpE family phage tail protein [Oceanibacterium hippocampi]SLN77605.1 hypothetical protein OCH7691_04478 [Oceanibacterium hippocampi]